MPRMVKPKRSQIQSLFPSSKKKKNYDDEAITAAILYALCKQCTGKNLIFLVSPHTLSLTHTIP